ncbi:MAG TPA: tetratricopeptide repeat protein [Polyangiaceae bacterium]|nr:tetratricopeptide repeat protein [Polyangiaceae bacterium]
MRPTSKTDDDRIRVRYREALDALEAGRWHEALAAFDEVATAKEAAVVFYYRGLCLTRLERWPQAEDDFARAVALAANRPDADSKFVLAESLKALREVKEHMGEVALVVRPLGPGDAPHVTFDDAPLPAEIVPQLNRDHGMWGPIRLAKGEHTVAVQFAGRAPLRRTFTVPADGDGKSLQVVELEGPRRFARPEPPPPPAPVAPPWPARPPGSAPWVGGFGVGLGVASLGLVVAHVAEGHGGDRSYLVPAAVTGGGAALAGVAAWLLTGPSHAARTAAGVGAPARGSLAPFGMPGGGGVAWAGALW